MRLNKFIADAGVCSRRKADEMIKEGRVTVNKQEAVIGMEVSSGDVVRVDGEKIKINTNYEYYMLNKPKRVICSSEDKFGRKLAIDYIKSKKRLYTYGRLDYMTEGLIIISNDGDIYNHVMHPSKKLYKSYIAKLDNYRGASGSVEAWSCNRRKKNSTCKGENNQQKRNKNSNF